MAQHERRQDEMPDRFRELFEHQRLTAAGVTTDPEHRARMAALAAEYERWLEGRQ